MVRVTRCELPVTLTPSRTDADASLEAVAEPQGASLNGMAAQLRSFADFPPSAPAANPVFYRTYSRRTAQGRESWQEVCERSLSGLRRLGNLNESEVELLRRMQREQKALPSGRWLWIGGVIAAAVPTAVAMWYFVLHDYQKQRVLTFLDPESDPLGTGWNIIQSKAAIGSGGVFGKGWLLGTQSHLDFLPESHTDFIIAVLGEEFGLVGICLLLLVYLLLVARGLVITAQAQTLFGKLLAGSLTMTFFIYVFINIGMVSGLLPVVGVPLPFISYGGTSMVTLMTGFGILMSIHTHRKWIAQV